MRDEIALAFFADVAVTFGPERLIAAATSPVQSLAAPSAGIRGLRDRLARAAGLDAAAARTIVVGNASLFERP